jgi:putative ABC transport system permease protein
MRRAFFLLDFACKDLLHHWSQALLQIFGLAFVVFSYIILASLAQTMQALVRENKLNRNLVLIQSDAIEPDEADIAPHLLSAMEAYIPATISRISPMIFRQIRISDHLVQLRAVPPSDLETVHHLMLINGRWPSLAGEVVVGEGAERAFGWRIGTILRIYGRDFRVIGVFRSPGTVFASVWIPLDVAQEMFAPRRTSQLLMVQVAPGMDADQVRSRLQKDPLVAGTYTVYFEDNFTRRNTQALEDISSLMKVTIIIALLSVIFGAYNATGLSLAEQGRPMGILRAVGFGSGTVIGVLLARALLMGLLAYFVGLAAAWIYIYPRSSAAPLYVYGWPLIYRLDPGQMLAVMAWTVACTSLGAWLSARPFLKAPVTAVLGRQA